MSRQDQSDRADIYIVHTELEWVVAKALARALDAHGYVVAPTKTLELPDRRVIDVLPADADAVIVIWPIAPTEFGMPSLELEARAAAQRGNLVQICAGHVRPAEPYPGRAPLDFKAWDPAGPRGPLRALLGRLRPLCGPPRRRPRDVTRSALNVTNALLYSLCMLAVGVIFMALGQGGRQREVQATAPPVPFLVKPEETGARVALSTAIAKSRRDEEAYVSAEPDQGPNAGGLENGYDKDLGVDPADTRIAPPPAPPPSPPPARHTPQGPER